MIKIPCLCKCGAELVFSHYTKEGHVQLKCPKCAPYINVCWNCHCDIDSRVNKKSTTPNMGYVCGNCGKDLTEWKMKTKRVRVSFCQIINNKNERIHHHAFL